MTAAIEAELIESAWGIIANVNHGDWTGETQEWRDAAEKWREQYHDWLQTLERGNGTN